MLLEIFIKKQHHRIFTEDILSTFLKAASKYMRPSIFNQGIDYLFRNIRIDAEFRFKKIHSIVFFIEYMH